MAHCCKFGGKVALFVGLGAGLGLLSLASVRGIVKIKKPC